MYACIFACANVLDGKKRVGEKCYSCGFVFVVTQVGHLLMDKFADLHLWDRDFFVSIGLF